MVYLPAELLWENSQVTELLSDPLPPIRGDMINSLIAGVGGVLVQDQDIAPFIEAFVGGIEQIVTAEEPTDIFPYSFMMRSDDGSAFVSEAATAALRPGPGAAFGFSIDTFFYSIFQDRYVPALIVIKGQEFELAKPTGNITRSNIQVGFLEANSAVLSDENFIDSYLFSGCGEPASNGVHPSCLLFFLEPPSWQRVILRSYAQFKEKVGRRILFVEDRMIMNRDLPREIAVSLFLAIVSSLAITALIVPMSNGIVKSAIRRLVFGNDRNGERPVNVGAGTLKHNDTIAPLPDKVEYELQENSAKDATAALERMRVLFAKAGSDQSIGNDPLETAMKFEKSELIHNAYFHSSLFIKYLAAQMIEKFDLTPSEKFKSDKEAMAFKYTV